jgi:hypothetical protein
MSLRSKNLSQLPFYLPKGRSAKTTLKESPRPHKVEGLRALAKILIIDNP